MSLIADIMLATGAFLAALYCFVLSRRLARFTNLEGGMGSAVAMLSMQVDDLNKTLQKAHAGARASTKDLAHLAQRAEGAADRLELMMAALHETQPPEDTERSRPRVKRRRREAEPMP